MLLRQHYHHIHILNSKVTSCRITRCLLCFLLPNCCTLWLCSHFPHTWCEKRTIQIANKTTTNHLCTCHTLRCYSNHNNHIIITAFIQAADMVFVRHRCRSKKSGLTSFTPPPTLSTHGMWDMRQSKNPSSHSPKWQHQPLCWVGGWVWIVLESNRKTGSGNLHGTRSWGRGRQERRWW